MNKIIIKPNREKSVRGQHPWLFSGAVQNVEGSPENGDIVAVYSSQNKFLGKGFYNKNQSIAVRFLTFKEEEINYDFIKSRFIQAMSLRTEFIDLAATNAYRLIHGEGDFLPGLTVDIFDKYAVLQISTAGIEKLKPEIIKALQEIADLSGIFEKSDLPSRKVEGLPVNVGPLAGTIPEIIEIKENGLLFQVNIKEGQKTGFFLDQRDNRLRLSSLIKRNDKFLNCFCYTGAFSVYAAQAGAYTTNVDISADALKQAEKNIALNKLETAKHNFTAADAFEYLRKLKKDKRTFDIVLLDPPAFTKNASSVNQAARGYKDINLNGIQLVKPNGILITCSCSQYIDRMLFQKIVHDAGIDAVRQLQLLEIRGQAIDHPINASHPEGEYLKTLIFRVI